LNDNHEKLNRIGNQILTASRNELYVSMRFLDIALSALTYEMNLSSLFVGTDGEKILFNPRYLAEKYLDNRLWVNRTYLHMLLHCILRHPFNQDERDEELWYTACDIAVESIIDTLHANAIKQTVSDLRNETYDMLRDSLRVLSAEGIYRILKEKQMPLEEFGRMQLEFWMDDHVFWKNKKPENDDNQNDNDNSDQDQNDKHDRNRQKELQEKWQQIGEKTETNLETFSKDFSDETGDMLHALKIENRERYDYRRFLDKFVTLKEDMRVDDDAYDYIFYTYGLNLYGNLPLIEALEYKEVKKIEELVIAIDTSASCDISIVQRFLEETYAILKNNESFFRTYNIHILQADATVARDKKISSEEDLVTYMNEFEMLGGGGTDFRPVFTHTNRLIEQQAFQNLKGLIYFTDGYGTFPTHRPPFDTAFVFFHEDYLDVNVPPWAMKVILGPEDFTIQENKEGTL